MKNRPVTPAWSLIAPAAFALLYPYCLKGYHSRLEADALWPAITLLALACCAPLAGCIAACRLGRIPQPNHGQVRAKLVALLALAAPPMYTAAGVLLYMAGDPLADTTVWIGLWGALLLYGGLLPRRGSAQASVPASLPAGLRVAHGISALAIVLLFLAMHLSNHLAGLSSEATHRRLMDLFRSVYRAHLVEPAIVLLFLFQLASGLMLLRSHLARAADFFRSLQLASGTYLLFFILGHMNSVFIYARRFARIETDWNFAVGAPTGMLHDAWNIRLLPHYYFGVFFVLAHLVLGARVVALGHGLPRSRVDKLAKAGLGASALIALLILLGMCGVHLSPGDGIF